jgi:hypothetical protein
MLKKMLVAVGVISFVCVGLAILGCDGKNGDGPVTVDPCASTHVFTVRSPVHSDTARVGQPYTIKWCYPDSIAGGLAGSRYVVTLYVGGFTPKDLPLPGGTSLAYPTNELVWTPDASDTGTGNVIKVVHYQSASIYVNSEPFVIK